MFLHVTSFFDGFNKTQIPRLLLCVFRCLDYLLDNGANPTLKNSKGYSAVHYAAAYGNKQHLELVSGVFVLEPLILIFIVQFISTLKFSVLFCCFFSSLTVAASGDFIQLSGRGGK